MNGVRIAAWSLDTDFARTERRYAPSVTTWREILRARAHVGRVVRRWIEGSSERRRSHQLHHVALVDLANVCPTRDEQDHIAALLLVAEIVRDVCAKALPANGNVLEVECRFYGGFRGVDGRPTERHVWLARHVEKVRGLRGHIRIVPTIVEGIAAVPGSQFIGTYANQRQVMVDAMIAEDLGTFARSAQHGSIVLISDDDDFVPSVLAAVYGSLTPVTWVRKRQASRNDGLMRGLAALTVDGRWQ